VCIDQVLLFLKSNVPQQHLLMWSEHFCVVVSLCPKCATLSPMNQTELHPDVTRRAEIVQVFKDKSSCAQGKGKATEDAQPIEVNSG
jgi:hypothetical protein